MRRGCGMSDVMLDTWTFREYMREAPDMSADALDAIEAARRTGRLLISVLTYLAVRRDPTPLSRKDLGKMDAYLKDVRFEIVSLDQQAAVAEDSIAGDLTDDARLIAATALS